MHPILFETPFIEARSYYALWAFALLLFIVWTRGRAVNKYNLDADKVSSVIVWIYFAAMLGALAGGAAERLPLYISGEVSLETLLRGGLSSGSGLLCGGLAGIYRLRKLDVSVDSFADAAMLPTAVMIAVGRNGCFMEGCCLGVGGYFAERPWWGLHFPSDPAGFYRYPSQLSEAAASLLAALILYLVEKYALKRGGRDGGGSVLAPLSLIFLGLYRLVFDNLRVLEPTTAFRSAYIFSPIAIAAGIVWGVRTYRLRRR